MSAARLPRLLVPALLLVTGLAAPAAARGNLQDVEKEFSAAIAKVSPATVICVAHGVAEEVQSSSSGVIVSRDGYVLSDGDAGAVLKVEGRRVTGRDLTDDVDVRVPDLQRGGFATYRARVVKRVGEADTSLLKILEPPAGGFPEHLVPATSANLMVGDFTFTMGNSFGMAREAPPTLTAGVVASLKPMPAGSKGGAVEFLYTSAAVNPGVNGGPCVDVEGRLVGTVSTFLQPEPREPFQFLGKVIPIDRVRAAYEGVPEADAVFSQPFDPRRRAKNAEALETVFRYVARRSRPAVVSLEVERAQPLNSMVPRGPSQTANVPRYLGPVSAILLDGDGWIVTSLYNLTNTLSLLAPQIQLPAEAQLETGLRAIKSVTVHIPGAGTAPAEAVAYDGKLGIALLKAKLPGDQAIRALPPAPESAYVVGRFVMALGNPFGKDGREDPFLTVGILSKVHVDDAAQPWRGQWQTDAGVTDGNCGGALVDLEGRLLGMLQIWHPTGHGRNSGIGFVVPWPAIEEALPPLKEGKSRARGQLGIAFRPNAKEPVLTTVTAGSPAERAGLKVGDRITAVDGNPTPTVPEVIGRLQGLWAGERVKLRVERDGETIEIEAELGARS